MNRGHKKLIRIGAVAVYLFVQLLVSHHVASDPHHSGAHHSHGHHHDHEHHYHENADSHHIDKIAIVPVHHHDHQHLHDHDLSSFLLKKVKDEIWPPVLGYLDHHLFYDGLPTQISPNQFDLPPPKSRPGSSTQPRAPPVFSIV